MKIGGMMKKIFLALLFICLGLQASLQAGFQPKQGQLSGGLGHIGTNKKASVPTLNSDNTETIQSFDYDPGFSFYGAYGLTDSLSAFFYMTPFSYQDKKTGDKADLSYMKLGLQFNWLDQSFLKMYQQVYFLSYSEKNTFSLRTDPEEVSKRFNATKLIFQFNISNRLFLLDKTRPFIGIEYYLDAPSLFEDTQLISFGVLFEFSEKIDVIGEYNDSTKSTGVLLKYSL